MGIRVVMAGQDITPFVDEMSISIDDTLGQGVGSSGSSSGRAATCEFVTTLGPAASASGAGGRGLVRQGEVQIFDASGRAIFGGFVGKLEDQTEKTRVYTKVSCYDYWQHLDRFTVAKLYTTVTDTQIILDVCKNFVPWLNTSGIIGSGAFQFAVRNYKSVTVQKVFSGICDVTGYQMWISPDKILHYINPVQSQTAPFALDTAPNFASTFPFGVESLEIDDTAAVNRVTFYGGKKPSNDFTQDLSTQANGNNTLFILAYYPREASNGRIDITVNGVKQTVGYLLGTGRLNKFKGQGGICDVLLNADAHTLTFLIPPPPGAQVQITYRYEYPLVVQLVDQSSFQFYGQWFDGVLSDQSVFDTPTAVSRCRVLLVEQSRGLVTLKVKIWNKPGLQSGQVLHVNHPIRGINNSYVIYEVKTVPLGAGMFRYDVSCGAWNWNLTDVLMKAMNALMPNSAATTEENDGQTYNATSIQQSFVNAIATYTTATKTYIPGQFYARSAPVNDGHDAYAGRFTISS